PHGPPADVPLAHNPLRARGGTELRAVERDQSGSEQSLLAAEQYECPARPHDSRPVIPPEVRNRLKVLASCRRRPGAGDLDCWNRGGGRSPSIRNSRQVRGEMSAAANLEVGSRASAPSGRR